MQTPQGPGSVSAAPNLPAGFTDTFSSRFVDVDGVKLHAVVGGDGPPLLLIDGWPETWYAWRLIMPALAERFTVVAPDQREMGISDKPRGTGYDSASLASELVAMMETLGHDHFAVVGHDTGMIIAYALTADHPDRVERLAVAETTLPGVAPSPPGFGPDKLNDLLWHISTNRLAEVNQTLIEGKEDVDFGFEFEIRPAHPFPPEVVKYYIDAIAADPQVLRGTFELYRAIGATVAQNAERKAHPLTMPMLAIGGAAGSGDGPGKAMQLAASNVQIEVIPDAGHFVAEEAPDAMVSLLTAFLAPYARTAAAAAVA
jgi:pimeloyl-ACP methyl ester carboxylesterase